MSFFKDKNILVTGGTGLIGMPLVSKLVKLGANLTVVSLDKNQNLDESVDFLNLDLRNFDNCIKACENQEIVFNLIGVKGSPKMTLENPASFFIPTITFSINMMEAARLSGVQRYLFTSSIGVYHPADVFNEDDVWSTFPSENDRFAGWAKRMGELQAQAYEIQYKWDKISIVRPANVYGPYDNFDPENAMVIPSLIRKAYENDIIEVWGDGSPIRDFIHCRDVALGMIHLVKNKVTDPVNLGSGSGITIKQIADIISKRFEKKIIWQSDKPMGDHRRVFNTDRAENNGFKSKITLETGINETIDWFLENKEIIDERYNVFK